MLNVEKLHIESLKMNQENSPKISSPSPKDTKIPVSGLLLVPKKISNPVLSKHKRAGSTGTTGDESTDEEDNPDPDEPDFIINNVKHFDNFGYYSGISTIADKVEHLRVMHRNSSDSSVYSEKCSDDLSSNGFALRDGSEDSDCKSGASEKEWRNRSENEFMELQQELREAHKEIQLKDEEVGKLTRLKQSVENELEDLTASLFEEAHNMVREANEKQAAAEKALTESQMKVDVLTAEVAALKTLVLTSTPSKPNPHLHPQIRSDEGVAIFTKKHRRSPSHFNLKYGRENSPPQSPVKEPLHASKSSPVESKDELEVDPVIHKEFMTWKEKPTVDKSDPFISRIYQEDIDLCLCFTNTELTEKVRYAVENGTILIEAVGDKTKTMFPKKCALLEIPRLCYYRMNIGETETWYSISQICRNRVIAVCDFLNYLKYIERGLVKSSPHDIYWEIVRLRKNIVLARLGLNLSM